MKLANLDVVPGDVSDVQCELLNVSDVQSLAGFQLTVKVKTMFVKML